MLRELVRTNDAWTYAGRSLPNRIKLGPMGSDLSQMVRANSARFSPVGSGLASLARTDSAWIYAGRKLPNRVKFGPVASDLSALVRANSD